MIRWNARFVPCCVSRRLASSRSQSRAVPAPAGADRSASCFARRSDADPRESAGAAAPVAVVRPRGVAAAGCPSWPWAAVIGRRVAAERATPARAPRCSSGSPSSRSSAPSRSIPAGKRDISLAFVFIISIQLLFGWEWSVLAGAFGIALAMTFSGNPGSRSSSTPRPTQSRPDWPGRSARLQRPRPDHGYGGLVARDDRLRRRLRRRQRRCWSASRSASRRRASIRATFVDHLRHSGPIFAIMVFVAAQAVIFWRMSAGLVLLLGAPILALTLYQRAYVRRRTAEEEAATDSLTALKNRRAFEDEASRAWPTRLRRRALPLPDRHRPLQAGQRPPRTPGGRRAARPAGERDRRGRSRLRVPARRRRARLPAVRRRPA